MNFIFVKEQILLDILWPDNLTVDKMSHLIIIIIIIMNE